MCDSKDSGTSPTRSSTDSLTGAVPVLDVIESLEDVKNETVAVLSVVLQQLSSQMAEASEDVELRKLVRNFSAQESTRSLNSFLTTSSQRTAAQDAKITQAYVPTEDTKKADDVAHDKTPATATNDNALDTVRRQANGIPSASAIANALDDSTTNRLKTASILRKYQSIDGMSAASQKYLLAVALASLCNALYQLLTMQNSSADKKAKTDITGPNTDTHTRQGTERLVEKLSTLERNTELVESTLSPAELCVWMEVQFLLNFVQFSVKNTELGRIEESSGQVSQITLGTIELAPVINAIDRVYSLMPRLLDQTFVLTKEQELKFEAAALWKLITRMNRDVAAYDDQRAPLCDRHEQLNDIIHRVMEMGQLRLNDQRVAITERKKLEIEGATIGDRVLRVTARTRMYNQDFVSKEQRRLDDLSLIHTLFQTVYDRTNDKYNNQRYTPSESKQRTMYLNSLGSRVDRAEEHRLTNQDAESSEVRRERFLTNVEASINRLPHQYVDQRASFSSRYSGNVTPPS